MPPPNRRAFLAESLADLDASLRELGGALDVRRGDVVAETVRAAREVGATTVFASADVSPYAVGRERRLAAELDLRLVDGNFVVPAGEVAPTGNDHYQVFSPYHRAWSQVPLGAPEPTPGAIRLPPGVEPGPAPRPERAAPAARRRERGRRAGGSVAPRRTSTATAPAATTRSPPTRPRGSRPTCTSAASRRARSPCGRGSAGGDAFVRQLCWRDFYAQILFARPRTQVEDMRPRGDRWLDDPDGARGLEGRDDRATRSSMPACGSCARKGWMHNRARMVAASFLVKDLGIDWREGARHFFDLLLDGDVAQNVGNWQWVAGTGVDTPPEPRLQPDGAAEEARPRGGLRAGGTCRSSRTCPRGTSPSRACWRRRTRARSSTTRRPWRRSGGGVGSDSLQG